MTFRRGAAHALRDILGKNTVLATLHVKTLDFNRRFCRFFHLDGSIFLFLQEQEALEDTVEVDLEESITLVDLSLELGSYLKCFVEFCHVGVNEHRVCVTIDDLRVLVSINST